VTHFATGIVSTRFQHTHLKRVLKQAVRLSELAREDHCCAILASHTGW
jgi:hypothetical protein